MQKSSRLRLADFGAISKLIGECRDLGDDREAWWGHLLSTLGHLVDSECSCTGEMAGCRSLKLKNLGVAFSFRDPGILTSDLDPATAELLSEPKHWPALTQFHKCSRDHGGACLTRKDFIDDRAWKSMPDYHMTMEIGGVDHRMWCFRPIPDRPDENFGAIFYRVAGRRDFAPRDRAVVGLACELLAPMVGGPLARVAEPSPRDLAPQVRRVLRCLLEGDSDRQIAARMKISVHTVNQYTKAIYRHFGAHGRAELMSRWIRRGWGAAFAWAPPGGDAPGGESDLPGRRPLSPGGPRV